MKILSLLTAPIMTAAAVAETNEGPSVRGTIDKKQKKLHYPHSHDEPSGSSLRHLEVSLPSACSYNVPPRDILFGPCCGVPPCWCDDPQGDTCPDYPEEKIYTDQTDIIEFFEGLTLRNPSYKNLQLCVPDDISTQFGALLPIIEGVVGTEETCSEKRRYDKGSSDRDICCVKFRESGRTVSSSKYEDGCGSEWLADSYDVKSFKNGACGGAYFPLHEGACGVCSTAQDLAAYMNYSFAMTADSPTLTSMSFGCIMLNLRENPSQFQEFVTGVSACLQGLAGLSQACSVAWGISSLLDSVGCQDQCQNLYYQCSIGQCPTSLYNATTCELEPCLQCDETLAGPIFNQLAGMNRRRAGLHTNGLPRPCGSLANIAHKCVAKCNPSHDPV